MRKARGGPVALVSDTHIAADEARENLGQTMAANLRAVVEDILGRTDRAEHALINGDLALKDGQPGDYATLATLLDPMRKAGVAASMTLGNHDDRVAFRKGFGVVVEPPPRGLPFDKHTSVIRAGGQLFLMLDSLNKVDDVPGLLGPEQLLWLMRTLDNPIHVDDPVVVVVHHNPSVEFPGALIDTESLLNMIGPRRRVKALVFGHSHRWSTERRDDGLWLVNLPAVGYPFAADQPVGWVELTEADGGVSLELRAIGGDRSKHGERTALTWR